MGGVVICCVIKIIISSVIKHGVVVMAGGVIGDEQVGDVGVINVVFIITVIIVIIIVIIIHTCCVLQPTSCEGIIWCNDIVIGQVITIVLAQI